MKRILAIDPGITTGVAMADENGALIKSQLVHDKNDIWGILQTWEPTDVVVEDFIGSGPRTKEATFVLKLIGGIIAANVLLGRKTYLQAPQQRLPNRSMAEKIAPRKTSVHILDAFAHCLTYLERTKDGPVQSE